MKLNLQYILLLCLSVLAACNNTAEMNNSNKELIFPKGEKITNDNFTGTAYLQMLIAADSMNPTAVGNVTFEPGARSKWHSHPAGQILLAIDGVGYWMQ
ncbi:MAG: hypothetical protein MUF12_09880 [Sediminibacterium sp.]|nr:hypothetical protein [Sediminibacterium sp.]